MRPAFDDVTDLASRVIGRSVYLSGPMTGIPDLNAPAFARAGQMLLSLGATRVFDPLSLTADGNVPGWDYEMYLVRCLNELTGLDGPDLSRETRRRYDLVVTLDGGESSRGSSAETAVARLVGIDILSMSDIVASLPY